MNSPCQKQPFPVLAAVFVGIAIWAGLIAAGVFYKSGSWGKTSVVIVVAVIFLGGWALMLKRK